MTEEVSNDYIVNMLTLRYDPTGRPPIRKRTWKDFMPSEVGSPEKKAEDLICNEIRRKIEERKPEAVSIGLSGGVDSTLILTLIRKLYPHLRVTAVAATFNDDMDESTEAKRIADLFDCEFRVINLENPLKDLAKLIGVVQEPRWNLYFYHVVEEASRHGEVFFTGDGGDELYGGYTFRYRKFMESTRGALGWRDKAVAYLNCHERDWVPDQKDMFGGGVRFDWERMYSLFKDYFDNPLDSLNQVFLADFNGKLLYDWIPTDTRIYSSLGVDACSPLLQETVIDFSTHLPAASKYDPIQDEGKLVLRSILRRHGVQVRSGKRGFGMDLPTLWRRYGKSETVRVLSEGSRVFTSGLISKEWFDLAFERAEKGDPRYINKMLGLVALEHWLNIGRSGRAGVAQTS